MSIAFRVEPGECVVLPGPSGAGKSSILKMIFGNYRCDGGSIGIRHEGVQIDLAKAEPRQILKVRRATIGYVSQFLRAVPRRRRGLRQGMAGTGTAIALVGTELLIPRKG
jgi:alpha-D-ribose 1-methylphosphonate 5-triphosphate synthase subunit PhnL